MKTRYIAVSKLLKQGTQGPFVTVHGKGTCFHDGNIDSIQKFGKDGEETTEETVCEFWPSVPSRISKADALLFNHFRNRGESLLGELENMVSRTKEGLKQLRDGDTCGAVISFSIMCDEAELELFKSKRVKLS